MFAVKVYKRVFKIIKQHITYNYKYKFCLVTSLGESLFHLYTHFILLSLLILWIQYRRYLMIQKWI